MGGKDSAMWHYFKASLQQGFLELRKHSEEIVGLIGIMRQVCLQTSTTLPGLAGGQVMLDRLKERFMLGKTDREVLRDLDALVDDAIDSWRTRQYDNFQYLTNGILY
jgi:phosphatidylinositol 4-kinase